MTLLANKIKLKKTSIKTREDIFKNTFRKIMIELKVSKLKMRKDFKNIEIGLRIWS
jgi:hypothetical protein